MKFAAVLVVAIALLGSAAYVSAARRDIEDVHRELLNSMHGRNLRQASASQFSSGSQSASSSASACQGPGCPGGPSASTRGSATGGGAVTAGQSTAAGQTQTCAQGPATSVECSTQAPSDRSKTCTDIPPGADFTCAQQQAFGKCDQSFLYLGAFCLKSCGRCGSSCTDVAPSGGSCVASKCNDTTITAGPYCFKTCGRCSTSA